MAGAVCCDTSFLFSLYGQDINTLKAAALARQLEQPVSLTVLNEFEFLNAVELSMFRKILPPPLGAAMIAAFASDLAAGSAVIESCNLGQIMAEAKRISGAYTAAGGYRSFDILHVAAALQLTARNFFSFDARQRALAKVAGLKVLP